MSIPFLTNVNLSQNELQNALIHKLSSAPGSPIEGQVYYNTTTHAIEVRTNSAWVSLSSGSGSVTSVDISLPSFLSVSGNPITTSGTLAVTLASQSAYTALARASGSGVPSFQAMDHNWISDFDTQVRTSRLDQMTAPTGSVSMNSQKITNLLTPSATTDAATKAYVDSVAQGLDPKPGARVATAAVLAACTYANGTSGVGATLTGNSNGALTVDGYLVVAADVVLVKNQAAGLQNGLYDVTQAGDGGTPFILTRNTSMDTTGEFQSAYIVVEDAGTANSNSFWVCTNSADPTIGTTAITFSQLNGATQLTAGTGITISGNTVSLTSGVATPGTYSSVVVDTYGRVTSGADIITSNGIVVRTSSGTFTNRTITGTSNRLLVTSGDGVSGNPTLDIHSSYVGQTSITTLGTITTGVWTGTAIAIANGGTGQVTAAAAFDALSPMTALGDVIYGGASGTRTALAGNITTTKKFLTQTGNGSVSAAPGWAVLVIGDIPAGVAKSYAGDVGDGAATSYVVNHALNTRDVVVLVRQNGSPYAQVITDVEATDANNVTVRFAVAPTSAQYRVIVHA